MLPGSAMQQSALRLSRLLTGLHSLLNPYNSDCCLFDCEFAVVNLTKTLAGLEVLAMIKNSLIFQHHKYLQMLAHLPTNFITLKNIL